MSNEFIIELESGGEFTADIVGAGPPGPQGKSLELTVVGDRVGVRIEGETEWNWIDIDVVDYEKLINKPHINYVELIGNKTFRDLGMDTMSESDIDNLF